ncbi:hypothetical protein LINPERHAP2_LOCUS15621 [Linum perenne]
MQLLVDSGTTSDQQSEWTWLLRKELGAYARVCVEVDISKPQLGKYIIEDRVLYIEYESLGNICYTCGFGHKINNGSTTSVVETTKVHEDANATTIEPKEGGTTGSWMPISLCIETKRKSISLREKSSYMWI